MTAASILTPMTGDTEQTVIDSPWNGLSYAVPWPGNVFVIVEKASGKAIAVRNGKICMEDHVHAAAARGVTAANSDRAKLWYCVETQGHFGFQNQASGKYMGHNSRFGMVASVTHHLSDEFIVVRKHPQGGYQLLALHNKGHSLRVISIDEDGKGLVTREHGPTLWEFYKVDWAL